MKKQKYKVSIIVESNSYYPTMIPIKGKFKSEVEARRIGKEYLKNHHELSEYSDIEIYVFAA